MSPSGDKSNWGLIGAAQSGEAKVASILQMKKKGKIKSGPRNRDAKGEVWKLRAEIERLRAKLRAIEIALARDENVDAAMKIILES